MKAMTTRDKEAISEALEAYCKNYPTASRASESLQKVSTATVSNIVNRKFDNISDDMFTRIAAQIGYSFESWTLHESENFKAITYVMGDAQTYKNVFWIDGDAGCGKTATAIEYRKAHRNVFYILCSEDMKRSDFVREIARQVGAPTDGTNLRDMFEYALQMITYLQNPLLILDEGDKLTDGVLNYFISIYNRLEGRAGIVFLSTDYIKRRMENGLRYNKKGYKEINSRIGRKFFDLNATSQNDVYAICKANGITSEADIRKVLRDAAQADNDLRKVKRLIHAQKRRQQARKGDTA
ncbi:MAG: AAA family ATPase [Mediterranea sp.]|jgi:hypothetical protein|nr:AAA family ATPase [Mediterranea sp.]